MQIGSLVRCLFQPRTSAVMNGVCVPMPYRIAGELGIYVRHRDNNSGIVMFPQFGYEHTLAWSALELVNEGRRSCEGKTSAEIHRW